MNYKSKILTLHQAEIIRNEWLNNNEKVVFTNGCFDIIHRGHIDYLNKAQELGTKLIVAVNSDSSVKKLKGNTRPFQDETSRAEIIASLACTDIVIIFNEETPINLIKTLKPEFLVKGSDYNAEEIVGYEIVSKNGGKVVLIDFLKGYSTSNIEKKIKSNIQ
ncbi:MAG: D-glycero-beta-D-manno-heptose 1-phosphate adenylyltransferase [Bacteroidia bacterium]|nr:D-glycero-beta-D-manno-heptose 1-phosphate adenylyltransferase [Bacteroidia bacterium]